MKSPTTYDAAAAIVLMLAAGVAATPPPNTALTLVAEVSDTTQANDTFWEEKCGAIPEAALYVQVVMGTVREALKVLGGLRLDLH
jgi:hypothetical protein